MTPLRPVEKGARLALVGIRALVAVSAVPPSLRHAGAIHLLVQGAGVPGASAARILGVSKQYVSKACSQIEARRVLDADLEAAFDAVELQLFPDEE
uniref:hypothetical protein n=1 Tax=Stappia sp. TaxID=1870903 RepID=UPI003BA93C59